MGIDLGKGFIDSLLPSKQEAFSHLEDFADRLSHFFSSTILLMLAGVTMANVYFLRPIACTLPTAPTNRFIEFAESLCWVRGTMALKESDPMPNSDEDWNELRQKSDISFYQWVPFCLSIQAMLFFVPHCIWQSIARFTLGENLESVLDIARKASISEEMDKRVRLVTAAAYQLFRLSQQHMDHRTSRWARTQRKLAKYPGGFLLIFGKRMGNMVSFVYLIIKILYLLNAIGQLYLIRTFLGFRGDLFHFGEALFRTLYSKHEWNESEFFPRQTYCPVNVRHLGTRNNVFTAICALPVNIFNEKIYIFLWIWIATVAVITALSLCLWLIRLSTQQCQSIFIRNYLISSIQSHIMCTLEGHDSDCESCHVHPDDLRLDQFIFEFVRSDGFFLIRMISQNAGEVVTGEILNKWWHLFMDYQNRLNRKKLTTAIEMKE